GETYNVEVPGEQYWADGGIRVDAEGYNTYYDAISGCWIANGTCQSYLATSRPRVPPPRARWMELVCGVGNYQNELREVIGDMTLYVPV
ncbi:unnamed protein product, partial [Choristocarpus tenellus]